MHAGSFGRLGGQVKFVDPDGNPIGPMPVRQYDHEAGGPEHL
jgi:hypothetical protein